MKLSKSQIEFIDRHHIDLHEVFDASKLSQKKYRVLMKEGRYIVAYGVSKCNQGHESLRSRSGHCVMCNPAALSFQDRHKNIGDLYVMFSPNTNLIKVGTADSAEDRLVTLNKQAYGDIKDWELSFYIRVTNAGFAEERIHNLLLEHNEKRYFYKGGSMVLAKEIFSCSTEIAITSIKSVLS